MTRPRTSAGDASCVIVVVSGHTQPMATIPTSRVNTQVTQNQPPHDVPVRSSKDPLPGEQGQQHGKGHQAEQQPAVEPGPVHQGQGQAAREGADARTQEEQPYLRRAAVELLLGEGGYYLGGETFRTRPKTQVITRTVISIGVSRMTESPSPMWRNSGWRPAARGLYAPRTMTSRRTLAP